MAGGGRERNLRSFAATSSSRVMCGLRACFVFPQAEGAVGVHAIPKEGSAADVSMDVVVAVFVAGAEGPGGSSNSRYCVTDLVGSFMNFAY